VSRIAISGGEDVVFFPLKKHDDLTTHRWSLEEGSYMPATLPIFGKYNEYGCVENIKEDRNTKLIEESFGIPIGDFCDQISRGYWEPEEANLQLKGYKCCWMLKEVYDFLVSDVDNYGIHSAGDFGRDENLQRLGFRKEEGVKSDSERYEHVYSLDGKYIQTDYRWINVMHGDGTYEGDGAIYYRKDIERLFPSVNKDFLWNSKPYEWIGNDTIADIASLIGVDKHLFMFELLPDLRGRFLESGIEVKSCMYDDVVRERDPYFLGLLSDVWVLIKNMRSSCCVLEPHKEMVAPQCGEYEIQKKYFEKYLEIVEKKCREIEGD